MISRFFTRPFNKEPSSGYCGGEDQYDFQGVKAVFCGCPENDSYYQGVKSTPVKRNWW